MSFRISKDFDFAASHHLTGLAPEHKCSRLHGHNYVVRLSLAAPSLDATGFVLDYAQLDPFKEWLSTNLDHRDLNEVLPPLGGPYQPSAENLALFLSVIARSALSLPEHVALAVSVSETPRTWATYQEDGEWIDGDKADEGDVNTSNPLITDDASASESASM